jgi:transcription antitermination factor NusA-like protein
MLVTVKEDEGTWTFSVSVPKNLLPLVPELEGATVRMAVTLTPTAAGHAIGKRPSNSEVVK